MFPFGAFFHSLALRLPLPAEDPFSDTRSSWYYKSNDYDARAKKAAAVFQAAPLVVRFLNLHARGVNDFMAQTKTVSHKRPPEMFRPLLWGLRWDALDVREDREAIIVAALNEGELEHLRWIVKTYGKNEIRKVLSRRLASEFHPESRHLAQVLFGVSAFRHAR